MRSTGLIYPIFERNLSFIIIHHPAKFHQNRSRTFWDKSYKHAQTHTQTHTLTNTYVRMKKCLSGRIFYSHLSFYLAEKLCFWTGIIFIGVYVSVCVCVCASLCDLSQKVLSRFWWNLAGWCIMIKDRFLSKMGWIGPVKRMPRPFEMFK